MIRAAATCLCLCAGPALACPQPGDLAGGITVSFDVQTITYRSLSPRVVESRLTTADGLLTSVTDLAFGVLPLGTIATFSDPDFPDQHNSYALDVAALAGRLPPAPGQSLALGTKVRDEISGATEEVVITVTAGQPGQVTIGDCSLAVLPLSVLFERPGHTYTAETLYLTDLGLSFVTRRVFDGFPPDVITPLTIAAE